METSLTLCKYKVALHFSYLAFHILLKCTHICLPVSNAIVQRFFGSLKRVKTGKRAAIGQKTTEDILTIMAEGPPLEEYDATSAVLSWYSSKSRRLNQKEEVLQEAGIKTTENL